MVGLFDCPAQDLIRLTNLHLKSIELLVVHVGAKVAVNPVHLAGLILHALCSHITIEQRLYAYAVFFDLPLVLLDGIYSMLLKSFHAIRFGRCKYGLIAVIIQVHEQALHL